MDQKIDISKTNVDSLAKAIKQKTTYKNMNKRKNHRLLFIILGCAGVVLLVLSLGLGLGLGLNSSPTVPGNNGEPDQIDGERLVDVPQTDAFFNIVNGDVLGWSEEVLHDYGSVEGTHSKLANYNSLNLSVLKNIGATCQFGDPFSLDDIPSGYDTSSFPSDPRAPRVWAEWHPIYINLSNTKWKSLSIPFDGGGDARGPSLIATGFETFLNLNLDTVRTIDLSNANFHNDMVNVNQSYPPTEAISIYTGWLTFKGCSLSTLDEIKFNGTKFAKNGMCNGDSNQVLSGCGFLSQTSLGVPSLNFDNTTFWSVGTCTYANDGEFFRNAAGNNFFRGARFPRLTSVNFKSIRVRDDANIDTGNHLGASFMDAIIKNPMWNSSNKLVLEYSYSPTPDHIFNEWFGENNWGLPS